MKRILTIVSTIMVSVVLILASNTFIYAEEATNGLTPKENAAFITRKEFNEWVTNFTASLSQLDTIATNKIYDDMNFYDMQYRFTEQYKTDEYLDSDGKELPKLKRKIAIEKAKRGLS